MSSSTLRIRCYPENVETVLEGHGREIRFVNKAWQIIVIVGREGGHPPRLPIDDRTVSRMHGAFFFEKGRFFYIDLASRNGSTADGLNLKQGADLLVGIELNKKTEIRIGAHLLICTPSKVPSSPLQSNRVFYFLNGLRGVTRAGKVASAIHDIHKNIEIRAKGAQKRCPYCHADLASEGATLPCPFCNVEMHISCINELKGKCPTRGCRYVFPKIRKRA